MFAQDLKSYQWENRLILVIANDEQQKNYILQIKELEKHPAGLTERKLMVFCVTSTKYNVWNESNSKWIKSSKLYDQFKKSDASFEVILIGLDGGIKARKTDVFKLEDLYTLIDGMPMRRAEIKNR